MKFYLSKNEYDLIVECSLLDGLYIEVTRCADLTYLCLTGIQVRDLIKRLFDNLWMDVLSIEEKRILSFLGWRLSDKCL